MKLWRFNIYGANKDGTAAYTFGTFLAETIGEVESWINANFCFNHANVKASKWSLDHPQAGIVYTLMP